jgi:hypothetical protein
MRTLACILLALPLWAAQNLTTTMTGVGTVSFSGISVTASTPVRWDFAFDSFSTAASDSARFIGFGPNSSLPLFGCRMSGTVLQCIDDIDTGAGFPSRDIANWDSAHGNYGFSARFERDPSSGHALAHRLQDGRVELQHEHGAPQFVGNDDDRRREYRPGWLRSRQQL